MEINRPGLEELQTILENSIEQDGAEKILYVEDRAGTDLIAPDLKSYRLIRKKQKVARKPGCTNTTISPISLVMSGLCSIIS